MYGEGCLDLDLSSFPYNYFNDCYHWFSSLIIGKLLICLVVPPSPCLVEAKEIIMTFSFLPVYFHFPQRVSSITICPAFLLIPFTFLPRLAHLTHYSRCQQVDYCIYCRALFNRTSGHCPQSWEWEADTSAEESGSWLKRFFFRWHANALPSHRPSSFFHYTLVGEISIVSVPGSQSASIPHGFLS